MMRGLLDEWRDGCIKMAVTAEILNFRRENPALFENGDYEPLTAEGPDADHLCAFARNHDGRTLVVAVTRWPGALEGRERLCQTSIPAPHMVSTARWRDVLTNHVVESVGGLGACEILRDLPFAVLTSEEG
jgi:(1->4)-alpha-D-glucan 1-alpha-D-glucosylmutase